MVRKPLEAVLRYLGIKTNQQQQKTNKQRALQANSANCLFFHFILDLDACSGFKNKQTTITTKKSELFWASSQA